MNISTIKNRKGSKERLVMLTCYDYSTACLLDNLDIDMLLVGDSLGMVMLGYDSTTPVTMEEMLHHARAVSRGAEKTLVIGDMPFLSYQVGPEDAIRNAGRFLKEAGCDAVKTEGGEEIADKICAMVRAGIPVMGHVGLTPQTASSLGGYKVQGRDLDSAKKILSDAKAVEEAGAFAIVLECIPAPLAGLITQTVNIPTIGIGAGPDCDGQVLVTHDLVGMFEGFTPSFVKRYAELAGQMKAAIKAFREDVREGRFPDESHSFKGNKELLEKLG